MESATHWPTPKKPEDGGAIFCHGNFHKAVIYGWARWPSYSYWIVPGTITDEERV